ncbi:MAG: hypothetical protein JWM90_547 [Thermoleophilia bacterium]|nr:hypothetical protein [Thermoleophilia bacterium]
MSDGVSPRITFLLRRLVATASDLQAALSANDWDTAQPIQDSFDEHFQQLQRLVDGDSVGFEQSHSSDLARLRHLHDDNERLAREMQAAAGIELRRLNTVTRIGGYAPLGANHQPAPRYIDGAA